MNLYSVDMLICGTAYIKAKTKKEALEKARAIDPELYVQNARGEMLNTEITGLNFDDERLPEVSLSPAMTIHKPWTTTVELQEEDVPESAGE